MKNPWANLIFRLNKEWFEEKWVLNSVEQYINSNNFSYKELNNEFIRNEWTDLKNNLDYYLGRDGNIYSFIHSIESKICLLNHFDLNIVSKLIDYFSYFVEDYKRPKEIFECSKCGSLIAVDTNIGYRLDNKLRYTKSGDIGGLISVTFGEECNNCGHNYHIHSYCDRKTCGGLHGDKSGFILLKKEKT